MRRPSGVADLYRRVGGMEARLDTLEGDSMEHTKDIQELKVTTTKIFSELENTNSALSRIEVTLKVVEQIEDIKKAIALWGAFMEKFFKYFKLLLMTAALLYAAYTAMQTGNITGMLDYINQIMTIGG